MSHTAPKGVTLEGRTTMSEGVDKIIFATQPRLVVHNGLNVSAKYKFLGINCISVKMKEIVPVAITDYSISIGESFYN
jgi:hypothetical protein